MGRVDRFAIAVAAAMVALVALAFAAGCSTGDAQEQGQKLGRFDYDEGYSDSLIVDTETGVQYLCVRLYGNSVSVTPLLDQWGFPLLADGYQRGARVEPSNDVDSKELMDDDQG